MMTILRWQDWITLVAGIWLLISPWAMGYSGETVALANAVVLGIAIIVYSIVELSIPRDWEEWLMVIAGIWLIISPWVLRFSAQTRATWDSVIVGVVVTLLALWAHSTLTNVGTPRTTNQ